MWSDKRRSLLHTSLLGGKSVNAVHSWTCARHSPAGRGTGHEDRRRNRKEPNLLSPRFLFSTPTSRNNSREREREPAAHVYMISRHRAVISIAPSCSSTNHHAPRILGPCLLSYLCVQPFSSHLLGDVWVWWALALRSFELSFWT